MSELKAYTSVDIEEMDNAIVYNTGKLDCTRVYLKSEADKVIAELKKERDWLAKDRAQAYDDLEKRAQLNIKQEESNRHAKYKRCLAMADYCYTNVHCIMGHRLCALSDRKKEWFERWHKRWLELAEKFKEAK